MKKLFTLLTVLALLLPVLAGCRSTPPMTNPGNPTTDTPQPTQTVPVAPPSDPATQTTAPTASETQLTREEAINIALKDAGLTREQVQDLDAELDRDDGTVHFDVDFEVKDKDYDYEIDANTGEIIKKDIPKDTEAKPASTNNNNNNNTTTNSNTTKQLTKDEAIAIALKHAGLTRAQVRDLDAELDRDDGTVHFDVDFEANGYDYEYEIHSKTGKILRSQKERD